MSYFMTWLITYTRNAFDAPEISADLFVYICDVTFEIRACTSEASRHWDTRELPLEQRPNLHQAGDPIEKHTDLLKHRYIIVGYNLPFSSEMAVCIWNSVFKHTAWSTSLLPREADDAGLAQFGFTRPVSRKNYHAHFRDRGWRRLRYLPPR